MKKTILLLLSLVLILGYANIALAVDKEPVTVEAEEETLIEEPVEEDAEAVEDEVIIEEPEEEEPACAHMYGSWNFDLIEHDNGSTTFYRWCECGAYEELDEQTFYDLGGQYENCEKGRHYWGEIRYCKECGYSEEI